VRLRSGGRGRWLVAAVVLAAVVVVAVLFGDDIADAQERWSGRPDPAVRDAVFWSVVVSFVYLLVVYGADVLLLLFAVLDHAIRTRERQAEDFDTLSGSRFTIPVSVVVPMANEEAVLVPVLSALLDLAYPEYEVIVVNDGSTDRTLDLLRTTYALEPVERFYRRILPSDPVIAIFRSANEPRLTVVDKVAGGNKAGALNCGVNLARYRYVLAVDGDTIYTRDALLKGMRLAMRDPATIVGVTSQISVASRPEEMTNGAHGEGFVDQTLLSNFQHIEYLRAFLNNRLGWSRLDFMLCTSGAYMLYRRDVLEEVGGFSRDFSCEDIELTFRTHERFLRERRPYRIVALPDLVAKTEGPSGLRALISQRVRWQRVLLETLWHYRRMVFNPRYRRVGMLGAPFCLVSEVLAPFVEVLAIVSLGVAAFFELVDWPVYLLALGTMAFSQAALSSFAILLGDRNDRSVRLRHLVRLLLLSPFELVAYRPWLFWAHARGAVEFFLGRREWGKFERNPRGGRAAFEQP
jgi:poly-beta-1,6-N-acetyl-D-glucosamine synthase